MRGFFGNALIFVLAAGGMWVASEQGYLVLSAVFGAVIAFVKIGFEALFGPEWFQLEGTVAKFLFGAFGVLLGVILGRVFDVSLPYFGTLVVAGVIVHLIADVYIIAHQEDQV